MGIMKYIFIFLFFTSSAFAQRTIQRGDMEYYDTIVSKRIERLHIGTTGQILTVASNGLPAWMNASGGGGVPAFPHDSTFFLRGDSTWAHPSANGVAPLTGGSVFAIHLNSYYGIGRSFNDNVTNTNPIDPKYGTPINASGTLSYVSVSGSGSQAGDTNIFVLYVAGSSTPISPMIVETNTFGVDSIHTAHVNAGDIIMIKMTRNDNVDLAAYSWMCFYKKD